MYRIDQVDYEVIAPFASRAAKEHVAAGKTGRTEWYAAREAEEVRGFAALMKVASGYRLKAFWVLPEARGNGIGTALLKHLIDLAENRQASFVEALALNPRIYFELGFRGKGTMRTGATKVLKLL